MAEQIFTLDNAVISLYRSNAAGDGKVGGALYLGANAAGLRLVYSFDEVDSWPSGEPYAITHHVNESHEISIERVWLVNGEEFVMERNALYVLEITWKWHYDEAQTRTRTYYGVTNRSANLDSQSVHEFMQPQVFRARWFETTESA